MKYQNVTKGTFISRPNRFIAMVEIDDTVQTCHVKNTGRCRELLTTGSTVILSISDNPNRRTKYDLIAVYKNGMLINMDSQAPNQVAAEYLRDRYRECTVRGEVVQGDSRLDFSVTGAGFVRYVEVKGVTLEFGGKAYFPDAPTERGLKHIRELIRLKQCGCEAMLLFVVQMEGMKCLYPNEQTHPAFGEALRAASAAGVEICAIECAVTPDSLTYGKQIPVELRDDR